MKNIIQSQKEFSIGEKNYVINLYDEGDQKYRVALFEKISTQGPHQARLIKDGSVIKLIPFNYLQGA